MGVVPRLSPSRTICRTFVGICPQAVPSRAIWRRPLIGPPTIKRSGSEHRRAVTSPLPEEEGLGEKVEPSLAKGRQRDSKKYSTIGRFSPSLNDDSPYCDYSNMEDELCGYLEKMLGQEVKTPPKIW